MSFNCADLHACNNNFAAWLYSILGLCGHGGQCSDFETSSHSYGASLMLCQEVPPVEKAVGIST